METNESIDTVSLSIYHDEYFPIPNNYVPVPFIYYQNNQRNNYQQNNNQQNNYKNKIHQEKHNHYNKHNHKKPSKPYQ